MNKKHIRTVIISAVVLLTAIITIINIDIEPANRTSQSSTVSSPEVEAQDSQAESDGNENSLSASEQKTEAELPDVEQKSETEKKSPAEGQENKAEAESSPELQKTETEPSVKKTESENMKEFDSENQTEENNINEKPKQSDEQKAMADVKPVAPTPEKPQEHFCTIEIRCDTVKDTSKLENQAVAPYVPKSGVILATTKMKFEPGESVFDILLRAAKERNIHMEYRSENVYTGGRYIEGINYLYEMDAGPLSGWMYKVNGKFPNYGCGGYEVKDGDAIVWMYSCDLGADVGDNSSW